MKLVIAEKKNMANLLKDTLKDNFKTKGGYYEGNEYVITWGYGHLLNSKQPDEYESFEGWNFNSIPFFPPNNELEYIVPNTLDFDKVRARQLNSIKEAYKNNNITEVVNACDAEREGELIFWEIYHFLRMKEPVKRLWLQSQEESDVLIAFDELKGQDFYQPKKEAAYARQYADYVLGHNLTVAFTAKNNKTLHVGRVAIPTLALLANRRYEIDNFVPQKYFELEVEFDNKYSGKWFKEQKGNTKLNDEQNIDDLITKVKGKQGKVIQKDVKKATEKPKELFNLGGLQKEANSKLNFTAKKTLDVAQDLYDKYKVISYPRTSSAHLMDTQIPSFKPILESMSIPEYEKYTKEIIDSGIPTNKNFVDNKKVTDHFAIIPTKKRVNKNEFVDDTKGNYAKEDLMKLYDLIAKRFLAVFFPAAEYEKTDIVTEVDGETFKTSGRILVNEGWKKVYGKEVDNDDKKDDDKQLPPIEDGEVNDVTNTKKEEKFTKPNPHYNDRTLIGAMETAKDYLEEDELKDELKNAGAGLELGTAATRDSIMENLIQRKYAERKGKQIIATDLGMKLIHIAPEALKTPEVTAQWEAKLKRIENGEYDQNTFKEEIGQFVASEIEVIKNKEIDVVFESDRGSNAELIGKCPQCGGDILDHGKWVSCTTGTKEKPCFYIWKEAFKKKLTKTIVKELVENGITKKEVQGLKTTEGNSFPAKLKMNDNYYGIKPHFDKEAIGTCPKCGKTVYKYSQFFACETNKRGNPCTSGPTVYASRTLTKQDITGLIEKRETEYVEFPKKDKSGKFEAKLVLDAANRIEMKFKPREPKKEVKTDIECPSCQKQIVEQEKVFKCESNCGFVAFKNYSGVEMTPALLKDIIDAGEPVGPFDMYSEKKKKNFQAKITYNKSGKRVEMTFN